MDQTTVIQGQTIWDIALGQYGSIEGVFALLDQNPQLLDINANLHPGMQLNTRGEKLDTEVVGYYVNNHVIVVSGSSFHSTGNPFGGDFNRDFNGDFNGDAV